MNRFDIVSAQPKAWSILSRSFRADRVASTYLFSGTLGAGHWQLALTFAALLNCEAPTSGDDEFGEIDIPCGTCRNCRGILDVNFEGLYPVVPIPPHKNKNEAIDRTNEVLERYREEPISLPVASGPVTIPVEAARKIKQDLSMRGGSEMTRVVVFDRMELMRESSADALLKLIEEPPPGTVIILIAERPENLLPTLQSRSQVIRLGRVAPALIASYLCERYEVPEERAALIARLSEGLPGKALTLVEQGDDSDSSGRSVAWLLFKALFQRDKGEVVHLVGDLVNTRNRGEVESLLRVWQSLIRDCAGYAVDPTAETITNIDFVEGIASFSKHFDGTGLASAMTSEIKNTLADFRVNVHIQTALVALVLKLGTYVTQAGHGGEQLSTRREK